MAYNLMILYPNKEGATFDMDYYLNSHMPLVERNWQPLGMITWKVIEFGGIAKSGEKAPHSIACLTSWKDEASCNQVMGGKTAAEVCGDTSRFSNMQPIFIKGRTVALG